MNGPDVTLKLPHLTSSHDLACSQIAHIYGNSLYVFSMVQYYTHVGRGKCSVVDTYWQTETGGHIATNFPGTVLRVFVLCVQYYCALYALRAYACAHITM